MASMATATDHGATTTQTMIPHLHHLTQSQSHRVLFFLEDLAEKNGTEFKLTVHARVKGLAPPALKKHFQLGKSPLLVIEDRDGKQSTEVFQLPQYPGIIAESRLILKFLSDNFGHGKYEPTDPVYQRQDAYLQEFANSSLQEKAVFVMLFNLIPSKLPWGLKQIMRLIFTPIVSFMKKELDLVVQLCEDTLSDQSPYFSGPTIGLADFEMMFAMDLTYQSDFIDKKQYPKVTSWYKSMTERPSYKRAMERGGDYNLASWK